MVYWSDCNAHMIINIEYAQYKWSILLLLYRNYNCNYKGLSTTPGSTFPTLHEQCVGSLMSHKVITNKGCETGPTVYHQSA